MEILCFENYIFFIEICFFSLLFDLASLFVLASASASIISAQIIADSSIILAKFFLFLQLHVAGFQI